MHIAKTFAPDEAAELWNLGHRDSLKDYILRDRVLVRDAVGRGIRSGGVVLRAAEGEAAAEAGVR